MCLRGQGSKEAQVAEWRGRKTGGEGMRRGGGAGPVLSSLVSCDVLVLRVPDFYDSHPVKRWSLVPFPLNVAGHGERGCSRSAVAFLPKPVTSGKPASVWLSPVLPPSLSPRPQPPLSQLLFLEPRCLAVRKPRPHTEAKSRYSRRQSR